MIIDSCGATHRGNIRRKNQDNIYVDGIFRIDPHSDNLLIRSGRARGIHTYGVFDGIGGGEHGEQASLIASQLLKQVDEERDVRKMRALFPAMKTAIRKEAADESISYMGTTAAVLVLDNYKAHVSNIGDSRVYLYRDSKLKRISYDHTREQALIERGILDERDRGRSRFSHELSQFIGTVSDEEMKLKEYNTDVDCREDDIFIVCSDGLTDAVSDEDLGALLELSEGKTAEHITVQLVSKALENDSRDNVSVIAVKIG